MFYFRLSPELHTSLSTVWDFLTPIVYKTGFSHTGLSTMWDFHTPHLSIFMCTFYTKIRGILHTIIPISYTITPSCTRLLFAKIPKINTKRKNPGQQSDLPIRIFYVIVCEKMQNNNPQKVGSDSEPLWARLQANRRGERDFLRKGGATAWVRDDFKKKNRRERYKVSDDAGCKK